MDPHPHPVAKKKKTWLISQKKQFEKIAWWKLKYQYSVPKSKKVQYLLKKGNLYILTASQKNSMVETKIPVKNSKKVCTYTM